MSALLGFGMTSMSWTVVWLLARTLPVPDRLQRPLLKYLRRCDLEAIALQASQVIRSSGTVGNGSVDGQYNYINTFSNFTFIIF